MESAIAKHWQSSKELTLAVANAMPDESYSFKATDGEMSFGEQMNHIAMADFSYCSAAIGEKPTMEKPADNTKATAVKSLNAAFDYCIAGIQKMSREHSDQVRAVLGRFHPHCSPPRSGGSLPPAEGYYAAIL
jgi:uncharacterized damage-inducible protein DinB